MIAASALRAVLLALPAALPQEPAVDVEPAVAREWRTRAWAVDAAHRDELLEALEAPRWERRAQALEAVARSRATGGWACADEVIAARLRAAVSDPHPTVRERALAALAHGAGAAGVDPAALEACGRDLLPEVRRGLVRALAAGAADDASVDRTVSLWARAVRDPDPGVAETAQRALLSSAARPALDDLVLELWASMAAETGDLASAALVLADGDPSPALLARIELLEAATAGGSRRRACLELVRLARGRPADLERVLGSPLLADSATDEERALLRAASRRGGAAWADALLASARRLAEEGAPAPDLDLRLELAAAALSPEEVLERAEGVTWPPPAVRRIAAVLGDAARRWPGASALVWWRAAVAGSCERAWIDAFAGALRRGDAGALAGLEEAAATDDAELREEAYRVLCQHPDPSRAAPALLAVWRRADAGRRADLLAVAPRSPGLAAFRDDLVAYGAQGGRARRLAAEHLELLSGDALVRATLAGWYAEALEAWRAGEEQGERTLVGAARSRARVEPPGEVGWLEALLLEAAPVSEEVGKNAAALLGESEGGRRRLREALGIEALPRVRLEVSLALAQGGDAAGVPVLLDAVGRLGPDLRVRVVRALGASGEPDALAFLETLVRAPREAPVDWSAGPPGPAAEAAAVDALARAGRRSVLLALAHEARTPETRANALLALRGYPDPSTSAALVAFLRGLGAESPGSELERDVQRLLRESALTALSRTGDVPAGFLPEVLAVPRAAAARWLSAEFRGGSLPSVEFEYQGELLLTRSLARAGRLPELLAATPRWYRLDARLLAALAGSVGDAEGAVPLLRGAAVAALGGDAETRGLAAGLRGELLARLDGTAEGEALARTLRLDRRVGELDDRSWREVARAAGDALPRDLAAAQGSSGSW